MSTTVETNSGGHVDGAAPTLARDPAQVAATRDLLLAVMALTAAGLSSRAGRPAPSPEGASRAAYAG
ncbi:hypothetical protein [Streptomyces nitrosporeus]|uniref:Uncharacterized protein n=1 Tax=Streptomyces nitrosporeus TaxID=28894 RepID=A0A5J6FGW3_9ACTN|nr:hypothetical protein [Streptomyces nitrosporeus]QEU75057.1 hypothetical protein CP967_26455 [Streptomyces nitrosporeus]GGY91309.1 hypothetical protein GCM10010327_22520 [Streptomyces nitrosporeus]